MCQYAKYKNSEISEILILLFPSESVKKRMKTVDTKDKSL